MKDDGDVSAKVVAILLIVMLVGVGAFFGGCSVGMTHASMAMCRDMGFEQSVYLHGTYVCERAAERVELSSLKAAAAKE